MLENIGNILRDYKADQELVVTEQTAFANLALDSLDMVELVMLVEEKFSVTIEMSSDIETIGDLIEVIKKAQ